MHVRVVNDDIIHTVRVFWVDAKGIGFAHETGVSSAENAISPGVAELPLPLLAEHLIFQALSGGVAKLAQTNRPGASMATTPTVVKMDSLASRPAFSGS